MGLIEDISTGLLPSSWVSNVLGVNPVVLSVDPELDRMPSLLAISSGIKVGEAFPANGA
jgi:hypothetical protein